MRIFSFGPSLTLRGREFRWLGGLSGKPLHAALSDIPIGGYVLGTLFDLVSLVAPLPVARDFYVAAGLVFAFSLFISILVVLAGVWDWRTSHATGSQGWRTMNAHLLLMSVATVCAIANVSSRNLAFANSARTPPIIAVVSIIVLLLVAVGATLGGSLVYDYGFRVEVARPDRVWERSEEDVYPGEH